MPSNGALPAVVAQGLSKSYRRHTPHSTTLKSRMVTLLRGTEEDDYVPFDALHDVSFTIPQGQMLAIVGQNGAGKSTLLRILAGIVRPSTGSISVLGRVSPILDLGAGFSPELTGRRNVYLYGLMLGMTKREISQRLPQIVDFSEIGAFIDEPVKHYSSGMLVRLAFAVVAHVDPDVLLIDEVLAVGDARYQERCLERIEQFRRDGKTIVLVTHSLQRYVDMCERALLLDHGRLVDDGSPAAVSDHYARLLAEQEN